MSSMVNPGLQILTWEPMKSVNVQKFLLRNQKEKCDYNRDFPGGPVVKTSPSNAGGAGSIPGQGAEIPTCLVTKKP